MKRLTCIFIATIAVASLLGFGVGQNRGIVSRGDVTIPSTYSLIVGSTTLSETELGRTDGLTAGAATASKAVVLDSTKTISGIIKLVSAKTADYTIVAATDTGKVFTNAGASGTVVFSLPAATVGQSYEFSVEAAQALRIDPNGSETISLPTTGVPGAAGKYIGVSTVGFTVRVVCCVAGSWRVMGSTGTWVSEA